MLPSVPLRPSVTGLLAASSVVLISAFSGDDGEPRQGAGEAPPPTVRTEKAEPTRVEVVEEYAGRARGAREVEVRARTQGILEKRLYDEGQLVSEGDPLPY